jgi:hypothetical protein
MMTNSMLLWAHYNNIMDCAMTMTAAKGSLSEQQRLIHKANLILAKWFLAVEAEISVVKVKEG